MPRDSKDKLIALLRVTNARREHPTTPVRNVPIEHSDPHAQSVRHERLATIANAMHAHSATIGQKGRREGCAVGNDRGVATCVKCGLRAQSRVKGPAELAG